MVLFLISSDQGICLCLLPIILVYLVVSVHRNGWMWILVMRCVEILCVYNFLLVYISCDGMTVTCENIFYLFLLILKKQVIIISVISIIVLIEFVAQWGFNFFTFIALVVCRKLLLRFVVVTSGRKTTQVSLNEKVGLSFFQRNKHFC